ncbi:LacI family transcriptional regulator [Sphingorhabdus lutea]|uniref:LacI family transcriptional regulator n=1 Tax=Sphingorhabdus lutea TaxID=1913578 RepID=A0A1L3JAP7_9SPHN|nr:LacI family DNA-binding transcriptional regulator [Sphingorhabdus lutea]APG62196.1 LacI family transcriptional regulator [Sphingorhabdus lutea]
MTNRPTSFDIAQLAGVSQPTVSRALSGNKAVSETTRKRIEAIAAQLNYRVDKNASSLRKQSSSTLALLFFEDPTPDDSLINPFFLTMLGSITRTCAANGYDLLISMQQLSNDWHTDYQDTHKADGIILLGYGDYEDYQERLAQLKKHQTCFVRWGAVEQDSAGYTLGSDNRGGGRMAAQHLHNIGRRNIAFLGNSSHHYPEFRERFQGFEEALLLCGISLNPQLQIDAITTEESGYDAACRLIAKGIFFDAIFAASDLIAIGAMRALKEKQINVPQEVAIIGFDNLPSAAMTNPSLTTISQDAKGAGEALVLSLLGQINKKTQQVITLPTKLMMRDSTNILT